MSLPYKFLPQVQAQRKPSEVQLDNGATCKLEIAHPVEKCFSGGVRNWDTSAFNFLWGAEHGEIWRVIRVQGSLFEVFVFAVGGVQVPQSLTMRLFAMCSSQTF